MIYERETTTTLAELRNSFVTIIWERPFQALLSQAITTIQPEKWKEIIASNGAANQSFYTQEIPNIGLQKKLWYHELIIMIRCFRRMKLKKEIQAIKELNEQEKAAQAAKAAQGGMGCDGGPPDSV